MQLEGVQLTRHRTVKAKNKTMFQLVFERTPFYAEMGDDTTAFTKVFLTETVKTLVIALLLVIAITYLFLQDWRATFVPAIAIPISLLGCSRCYRMTSLLCPKTAEFTKIVKVT